MSTKKLFIKGVNTPRNVNFIDPFSGYLSNDSRYLNFSSGVYLLIDSKPNN